MLVLDIEDCVFEVGAQNGKAGDWVAGDMVMPEIADQLSKRRGNLRNVLYLQSRYPHPC